MGESKVVFGDKLFLYGQYLSYIEEFSDYSYNSLIGYMTIGGYYVQLMESEDPLSSVGGLLVDFGINDQFTSETPFNQVEMVDVTGKLSLSLPLPAGCKVWAPTTPLL